MICLRRILISFFCLLALLLAVPVFLIWREVRQEQLNHALIAAIKRDDTPAALAALHSHADPICQDHPQGTRLFWQSLLAHLHFLSRSKVPPAKTSLSALTLAVEKNNAAIVQALLERGAKDTGQRLQAAYNGSLGEDLSCTLLMYAASKHNAAIVRALARRGSNVNAVDVDGDTALFYYPDAATVQALLDGGANVNAKDQDGWTALDVSIRDGDLGFPASGRSLLIDRGARHAKAMTLAASFGDAAALQKMLQAGWNPNTPGDEGWPPVLWALDSGCRLQPDAALLLIRSGANVNFRDKEGDTPLSFAADGGRYPEMCEQSPEVVEALLDKGARINDWDKDGKTPLMVAASHLRPVLVQLLLQRGARVNMRDKEGKTALSLARCSIFAQTRDGCQPLVIHMLKQAGAKE